MDSFEKVKQEIQDDFARQMEFTRNLAHVFREHGHDQNHPEVQRVVQEMKKAGYTVTFEGHAFSVE